MAENLKQTLERLRGKADILTQRYQRLLQEKQEADLCIKELTSLNKSQQDEINRLKQEVEYLKVVTTLNPDRETVEKSRAFLSGLVREIDKCIVELNQ